MLQRMKALVETLLSRSQSWINPTNIRVQAQRESQRAGTTGSFLTSLTLHHQATAPKLGSRVLSIHPSIPPPIQKIIYPSSYHPIHPLVRPYIHLSSTHPFCSYFIYQKMLSTEAWPKRPIIDICLFTAESKSSELSSMLPFHSAALF